MTSMDSLHLNPESRSYLARFGLREPPFSLSPSPRFVYESAVYSRTIGDVIGAINRREGLVLVTGDAGTGKTTLCRALVRHFGRRVFLSVVLNPLLSGDDLIEQVLIDFGVASSTESARPVAAGRHERVLALQRFLASLISLNGHAVVVIDEAQHLGPRVLEEIRLLSNFETDELKLLQVVLVGPPELESMLARPQLRQIDQRISRRCRLLPLADGEVGPYIERRLRAARAGALHVNGLGMDEGERSSRQPEFAAAAVKDIFAASGGIPRIVNLIADRALELASVRGEDVVTRSMVSSAIRSLDVPAPPRRKGVHTLWSTVVAMAASAIAGFLFGAGTVWWLGVPAVSPDRSTSGVASGPAQVSTALGATGSEAQAASPEATPSPTVSQAAPKAEPLEVAAGVVVVVASFRNAPRAVDVSSVLQERGLPSFARDEGGWYVVYVGPFVTREEAVAAQQALGGEFRDTRIRVLQE